MEEEITLDLRDLIGVLRKRLGLIVSITLIATILSGIISFFVLKPVYEASTSIVIGKEKSSSDEIIRANDTIMYQKLIKTYAAIAMSHDVVNEAIEKYDLDMTSQEFLNMTTVGPQSDTQIMNIKIQNKDPKLAKKMVDALSYAFIKNAKRIYPDGSIGVIDTAKVPEKPIKPNKKLNVAIAFFLGLMISVGISFLLEYMDNTVKTQVDVEKYLDMPVLGIIPYHDVD